MSAPKIPAVLANVTIPSETAKYLNPPATGEMHICLQRYADDLLRESSRLEASTSSNPGHPEITSTMVKDADLLLRRGYRQPKKKPWLVGTQIVATVASFLTGLLADLYKLKEPVLLVMFLILIAVAITTTVLVVVKE